MFWVSRGLFLVTALWRCRRPKLLQSLIQTSDGGYVFTAMNYTYVPSAFQFGQIPSNIALIKTGVSGELKWQKSFFADDVSGLVQSSDSRICLQPAQAIPLHWLKLIQTATCIGTKRSQSQAMPYG